MKVVIFSILFVLFNNILCFAESTKVQLRISQDAPSTGSFDSSRDTDFRVKDQQRLDSVASASSSKKYEAIKMIWMNNTFLGNFFKNNENTIKSEEKFINSTLTETEKKVAFLATMIDIGNIIVFAIIYFLTNFLLKIIKQKNEIIQKNDSSTFFQKLNWSAIRNTLLVVWTLFLFLFLVPAAIVNLNMENYKYIPLMIFVWLSFTTLAVYCYNNLPKIYLSIIRLLKKTYVK